MEGCLMILMMCWTISIFFKHHHFSYNYFFSLKLRKLTVQLNFFCFRFKSSLRFTVFSTFTILFRNLQRCLRIHSRIRSGKNSFSFSPSLTCSLNEKLFLRLFCHFIFRLKEKRKSLLSLCSEERRIIF